MASPIIPENPCPIEDYDGGYILKYRSEQFPEPIFMLWYYDSEDKGKSKLVVNPQGQIAVALGMAELIQLLKSFGDDIPDPKQLQWWLDGDPMQNHDKVDASYDVVSIEKTLAARKLTTEDFDNLFSFINLFDDVVSQYKSEKLVELRERESVVDLWDYYYSMIFWPRFNDKEKFEKWARPPFEVDWAILGKDVNEIIAAFEGKMVVGLKGWGQ